MPEPYAAEMVIMATLQCSPEQAHAEYASIEAILINLEHSFPLAHGTVTATKLNVRMKPDVKTKVLGTLLEGDLVTIWGRTVDGGWLAIEQPQGWVSTQHVREIQV
jgi:uncharacterized protein YgiM (DUF1202 family)